MVSKEDVLDLVRSIHQNQDDFIDGDIEERILKCDYYELTTVCPQFIDVEYAINEDKIEQYKQLEPSKCPPIVLIHHGDDHYELIDGSHRVEAFKSLGITKMTAYVGKYL